MGKKRDVTLVIDKEQIACLVEHFTEMFYPDDWNDEGHLKDLLLEDLRVQLEEQMCRTPE